MLDNITSESKPIVTGILQGSILGPLLFTLYVNTSSIYPQLFVSYHVCQWHGYLYLYDMVFYIDIKSCQDTITKFQSDLDRLASCCFANKLSINTSKTQVMVLGTNKRTKINSVALTLTLSGRTLSMVQKYTSLGVLLDPGLTLEEHAWNKMTLCLFTVKQS